jgi:hypothetical protein
MRVRQPAGEGPSRRPSALIHETKKETKGQAMTGRPQSNIRQARRSGADLGQKEAGLERASEEELRHMEGGGTPESARHRKATEADLGQEKAKQEKASQEELRHMEGGDTLESARQERRNLGRNSIGTLREIAETRSKILSSAARPDYFGG